MYKEGVLTMANFTLLCLLLFVELTFVMSQEPLCNKFSFEEQLLEKMVRLEFKVETMFASVGKSQEEMKKIAEKVDSELSSLKREREQTKAEMNSFKFDTSKRLDNAAKKSVEAISDFDGKFGRLSEDLMKITNESLGRLTESFVTYVRWGRTSCPNNSAIVYSGYASGSHYTHSGGPSRTICLPKDPQHGKHHSGISGTYIYNVEYEHHDKTQTIFGEPMGDEDVPCAVCEAKGKSAVLMVPARMECYTGWTKEYSGYLMTDHHTHNRSDLKCVDEHPEKVPGQGGNNNGELFYFVEAAGTLPDPPYTREVELTCVVCTK